MKIAPASDRSVLLSFGDGIDLETHRFVLRAMHALAGLRGLVNRHPAYASVLLDFDPRRVTAVEFQREIEAALERAGEAPLPPARTIEIPVCYGGEYGPDLEEVARMHGITPGRVIELHSSAEYVVYFLGFSPAFPYLGGLPEELATPRLPMPRKQVPAGSVAIGGSQTGIYPMASPGGWRLIGRTPLRLFRSESPNPVLLEMGDRIVFRPITRESLQTLAPSPQPLRAGPHSPGPGPWAPAPAFHPPTPSSCAPLAPGPRPLPESIRILSPGLHTTVQDLGRPAWAHFGISASGAADALALRAGNLLVGNTENAAALEMTLRGGDFAFDRPATVCLAGAGFTPWQAVEVPAGHTLRVGPLGDGARAYLCVRGGIEVPLVLGSASTHLPSGVGGLEGRALRRGDTLAIGDASVRRSHAGPVKFPFPRQGALRVTPGLQADGALTELCRASWHVGDDSNRMGLRLRGPALAAPPGHMLTEGVPLGAVQLPPEGWPIILFVEHQTTGGYPKVANVITADLWRVGQLRPRDEAAFETVSFEQATELLRDQERWLYTLLR